MDTGKAVFFGLALIALAIFATDMINSAKAGLMGSGRYMGTSPDPVFVWVVDTETGKVRLCTLSEIRDPATCHGWSE